MARDTRFKVVLRNAGAGPNELFDLGNDPRKKINQYENPKYLNDRDQMAQAIEGWRQTTGPDSRRQRSVMHRRMFLRAATGSPRSGRIPSTGRVLHPLRGRTQSGEAARDEDYWREIQQAFTVDRNIINLNNGGVCPSPQDRPGRDAALARIHQHGAGVHNVDACSSRRSKACARRLANIFGCDPEEMAITRNAREAWRSRSWASTSSRATKC